MQGIMSAVREELERRIVFVQAGDWKTGQLVGAG
jgi:hypothetical protein